MKKLIIKGALYAGLLGLASAQTASANTGGESFFSASSIFNFFLLICAVLCLLGSVKILSLVRGGLLSKGWQMLVLGFAALVLAQLFVVSQKAHIFAMPESIIVLLYLLMAGTWLVGLHQIRKILA